jgi:predicted GTPase
VINKVDTAAKENISVVEHNIRTVNPDALIIHTMSRIIPAAAPGAIKGKKVLVIEDGPTLTHGGMTYGAGFLAATQFGASEIVDPRPYARGSIKDAFERYPQIGKLLPAMGYGRSQIGELKEIIEDVPCDIVLIATPIDLARLLGLKKETVRIRYEIEEAEELELKGCIEGFIDSLFHK